jgi:hypothetical protein
MRVTGTHECGRHEGEKGNILQHPFVIS